MISGDLIFTVSSDGYLHIIDKNFGNIIRITDIYKNYKLKERKKINPVGFALGNKELYLTNSDGKMIVVNLELGSVINTVKVAGDFISKPFIFNQSLFIIKKGSIIKFN